MKKPVGGDPTPRGLTHRHARWFLRGIAAVLMAAIAVYRLTLSRLLGPRCRFHPTCSVYAREAIHIHGPLRGGALTAWRLCRCQPFSAGGLDPVPPATAGPIGCVPTGKEA